MNMKHLSKYFSIFLAFCLAAALLALPALAAEEESLPFTDVKTSDWFYKDVTTAYGMKLINGKNETTFAPNANLTCAEAVKLAACMFQYKYEGEVTLTNGAGGKWYTTYADYCIDNGIIDDEAEYDWNTPITRAAYMEIFAHALKDDDLAAINTIQPGAIPDVPASHPQAEAIYKLYRAGVVQGTGDAHNCYPDNNIRRSEVAAILTRMMNSGERISFTLGKPLSVSLTSAASVSFTPGKSITATAAAADNVGTVSYTWQWSLDGKTWKEQTSSASGSFSFTPYSGFEKQYLRCIASDPATSQTATTGTVTLTPDSFCAGLTGTDGMPATSISYTGSKIQLNVKVVGGSNFYDYDWYYSDSGEAGTFKEIGVENVTRGTALSWDPGKDCEKVYIYCVVTDNRVLTDNEGQVLASSEYKVKTAATSTVTVTNATLRVTTADPSYTVSGDDRYCTLSVAAKGGSGTYTYKWYITTGTTDNPVTNVLEGETGASVKIKRDSDDTRYYQCVVTDSAGTSENGEKKAVYPILKLAPTSSQYSFTRNGTVFTVPSTVGGSLQGGDYTYTWSLYSGSEDPVWLCDLGTSHNPSFNVSDYVKNIPMSLDCVVTDTVTGDTVHIRSLILSA